MFEKHKTNTPETAHQQPQQDNLAAAANTPANSGRAAVIGPGIYINGEISGDENLIIEGKVDGKIRLESHQVDVGQSGRVNADITAKVIKIAGQVRGDLTGSEKVIVLRSGNVHGNIVAPRMTLEDGAIFKGSIDMDPGEPVVSKVVKPVKKTVEKPVEKTADTPKVVASGKVKEKGGYSLSRG
jgi:cytoskeletal protein CcmA (bactofilin family)